MKVLVTRRKDAAAKTAERVEALGFEPVVFPLFKMVAVSHPIPDINPDFLIFTSVSGVENIPSQLSLPFTKNVIVYSVGSQTTSALKLQGYKNIRQGKGTAEDLADLIVKDFGGKNVAGLYISGELVSYEFSARFTCEEIDLERWIVYRSQVITPSKEQFETALQSVQGGVALLFSAASAAAFFDQVSQFELNHLLENTQFVAISKKTALTADKYLAKRALISDEPNERSLVDAVKQFSDTRS